MTEQNPKTFSITSFAKGGSYAKRELSFYLDQELLNRCIMLDGESNATLDPEESNRLAAEMEALLPELMKSRITVHMQGIPRRMRRQIFVSAQNAPDSHDYYNVAIIMAHITHLTDSEGNVDDTKWTMETSQEWLDFLGDSDMLKLLELTQELQLDAAKFDRNITTDFLSKS